MPTAVVGLLVVTAFVSSGCQYLLGGMMGGPLVPPIGGSFDPGSFGSFDPNDPAFSQPPPLGTFTTGTASVAMGGKTTTLDHLNGTAAIYADFGTDIIWTDGKGLFVRFYGEPDSPFGNGFVMLDQIADGQHWTTADPSACKLTLTQNDTKGVSGTASCQSLRWVDAMSADGPVDPTFITGQTPFDAEITFRAAP